MRQKRSEMIDRSITGSDRQNGPNSIFGSTSQFGNAEMGGNFDDEEMVRDRPSTVRNVLSENIGHQMGHYFPFEASLNSEYFKKYSHFEVFEKLLKYSSFSFAEICISFCDVWRKLVAIICFNEKHYFQDRK